VGGVNFAGSALIFLAGRVRRLAIRPSTHASSPPSRERRARILVNTPIQGSCANLYIRALNLIIPRLPPGGVELINLVHDEIDLIVPLGLERETKEVVTRGFEQAFKSLYGEQIAIRMEHRLGSSWAGGEKI
jgi:DNA polymerase I-like protein with 3'-5' exonuclease and polymerase domains